MHWNRARHTRYSMLARTQRSLPSPFRSTLHVVCMHITDLHHKHCPQHISMLLMLIWLQHLRLTVHTLQTRRQETRSQSSHTALVIPVQDFKDERELCEVCGKIEKHIKARGKKKEIPLLECDKCLRAFHSDCCTPSVKTIPEVDPFLCNTHTIVLQQSVRSCN